MQGKITVITGGFGVLGRAAAKVAQEQGARPVLIDHAPTPAEFAGNALAFGGVDLTKSDQTNAVIQQARDAAGGIDVLLNIAGGFTWRTLADGDCHVWDMMYSINTKTAVNASKAAFSAPLNNAAYAASKAAAAHFARCLATELAPWGIRANYVNADFIDTPMMRRMAEDRAAQKGIAPEAQVEEYRKRNLLKVGPIPPAAVAEAVLYFASDRSRYTTGSVLTVDGGLTDAMPR